MQWRKTADPRKLIFVGLKILLDVMVGHLQTTYFHPLHPKWNLTKHLSSKGSNSSSKEHHFGKTTTIFFDLNPIEVVFGLGKALRYSLQHKDIDNKAVSFQWYFSRGNPKLQPPLLEVRWHPKSNANIKTSFFKSYQICQSYVLNLAQRTFINTPIDRWNPVENSFLKFVLQNLVSHTPRTRI